MENLNDRRFMWTLYMSNAEHWVPISTVASFKRMREFTSLGVEWVARAVKLVSEELEVDETNTKVRRTTEVKEPKGQFERSVYAVSLFGIGNYSKLSWIFVERVW